MPAWVICKAAGYPVIKLGLDAKEAMKLPRVKYLNRLFTDGGRRGLDEVHEVDDGPSHEFLAPPSCSPYGRRWWG